MDTNSTPNSKGPPFLDDSSPENEELGGILWHLGELLRGDPPIDWQEDRKRCADLLTALAEGCEKSLFLTERLRGAEVEIGGSEHILLWEPRRVFKATFGDNLGCSSSFFPHDPELTGRHFHATGNADPFFYLERWMCLNLISTYQTRYEGILPPELEGQLPRICVSQPALPRQAYNRQNPTEREIEAALARYGYRKISADAFLNDDEQILLTDAAPRNVRILDGIPIPFDAIAEIASARVLEWAAHR